MLVAPQALPETDSISPTTSVKANLIITQEP